MFENWPVSCAYWNKVIVLLVSGKLSNVRVSVPLNETLPKTKSAELELKTVDKSKIRDDATKLIYVSIHGIANKI